MSVNKALVLVGTTWEDIQPTNKVGCGFGVESNSPSTAFVVAADNTAGVTVGNANIGTVSAIPGTGVTILAHSGGALGDSVSIDAGTGTTNGAVLVGSINAASFQMGHASIGSVTANGITQLIGATGVASGNNVFVLGGAAPAGGHPGGAAVVRGGANSGGSTDGAVFVGDQNTSSVQVGSSGALGLLTMTAGAITLVPATDQSLTIGGGASGSGHAGQAININGNNGNGGLGGNVNIDAGAGTTGGIIQVGTTNASEIYMGGVTIGQFDMVAGNWVISTGTDQALSIGGGGSSSANAGKTVSIFGNGGGAGTTLGGDVIVAAGPGGNINGSGGALHLRAGTKVGTGTAGIAYLGDTNTSAVHIAAANIFTTFGDALSTRYITGTNTASDTVVTGFGTFTSFNITAASPPPAENNWIGIIDFGNSIQVKAGFSPAVLGSASIAWGGFAYLAAGDGRTPSAGVVGGLGGQAIVVGGTGGNGTSTSAAFAGGASFLLGGNSGVAGTQAGSAGSTGGNAEVIGGQGNPGVAGGGTGGNAYLAGGAGIAVSQSSFGGTVASVTCLGSVGDGSGNVTGGSTYITSGQGFGSGGSTGNVYLDAGNVGSVGQVLIGNQNTSTKIGLIGSQITLNPTTGYTGIGNVSGYTNAGYGGNLFAGSTTNGIPIYALDIRFSSFYDGIHISSNDATLPDSGGYIDSNGSSSLTLAGGCNANAANPIAKATTASSIALNNGEIFFTSDSGLTKGSGFTKTTKLSINGDSFNYGSGNLLSIVYNGGASISTNTTSSGQSITTTLGNSTGSGNTGPSYAVTAGSATLGNAAGGNVTFDPGLGHGSGATGFVLLGSVNSCNVGIGTASPASTLHVNGTITSPGTYNATSSYNWQVGGVSALTLDGSGDIQIQHLNPTLFNASGDFFIRATTGGKLQLGSNNVNGQVILSNGQLGIGVSPTQALHVNGNVLLTSNTPTLFNDTGDFVIRATASQALQLGGGGVNGFMILTGTCVFINRGGTRSPANTGATLSVSGKAENDQSSSWFTFSDERLKNIDGDYTKGLKEILKLNPKYFHYKPGNSLGLQSTGQCVGYIAQEVEQCIPDAVGIGDSVERYRSLDAATINVTAINAIKDLHALYQDLLSRYTELAEKVGLN